MDNRRWFFAGLGRCALSVAVALLAACGGGGGGGTVRSNPPPAAPPPASTPPVVSTPNPAYSQHLALTNTSSAHAAGLTGKGIRIGVVDSGVTRNHPALSPRVLYNLNYVSSPPNNLSVDDVVGHGTAVSQIMAGTPFGAWPGGIAPGASIISARIISDKAPTDDGSGNGNEVHGALGLKPIHQDLIDRGAKIMNNSWGGLYWTDPAATSLIADEYRPFIDSNGGLVVFATGNESRPNPSSMAALPSQLGADGSMPAADLERGWLAVAAVDTDNPTQLAGYSNACGVAMHYCLAAPGKVVVTGTTDTNSSPTYWSWTGTSLAAPQVSGAAALVWEAFPYFNNDLVRQTLLGTAKDLGLLGLDEVYGYGLLDVGRAVNGPAKFDWGDVAVNFDGITSTWRNSISGTGGLIKEGTGTLVLEGYAAYSGDTRVLGGELRVNQIIDNSKVYVGPSATISGKGGVRSGLENHGTVSLGAADSLGIIGDYVQGSDGTLQIVLPRGLYVDGKAQIAGSLRVLGVMDGYVVKDREIVLQAYDGLSGKFDSVTVASGLFQSATVSYDAYIAYLDIVRNNVATTAASLSGIAPAALTSAQRVEAAFNSIDRRQSDSKGSISPAFIDMAGKFQSVTSKEAAKLSLRSLSGELHAAADAAGLDILEAGRRALSARFGELVGQSQLQGNWYRPLGRPGQGGSAFGQFQSDGWLMGSDQRLGANAVAGFAFGTTDTDGFLRTGYDRSHERQTQARFYAGATHGNAYALGQFGVGRYERQLRRALLLGDRVDGVATDYAGNFTTANLEAGYRFGDADKSLVPYAGVDYVRLDRDGFIENGAAGFGLKTNDSVAERTLAVVGLRAERAWTTGSGIELALRGYAEWQRALSDSNLLAQASFVGADSWSPLYGEGFSRSSGLLGLGFDAALSRGTRLSLGYDQRFGSFFDDRQWSAKLRYGF